MADQIEWIALSVFIFILYSRYGDGVFRRALESRPGQRTPRRRGARRPGSSAPGSPGFWSAATSIRHTP